MIEIQLGEATTNDDVARAMAYQTNIGELSLFIIFFPYSYYWPR